MPELQTEHADCEPGENSRHTVAPEVRGQEDGDGIGSSPSARVHPAGTTLRSEVESPASVKLKVVTATRL